MAFKPDTIKDSAWTEPESSVGGNYPYTNVTQTEAGHAFIMEDTFGSESLRIQHALGNFVEMHPNGDEVHKILGDNYEIIAKNNNVLIKGQCNITVEGGAVFQIQGDMLCQIQGNMKQLVEGNVEQVVQGDIRIHSQDNIDIVSDTNITLKASNIDIQGDLNVLGTTRAGSIFSNGSITAEQKIFAKISLETLGWISAGFPNFIGSPGQIKGLMVFDLGSSMLFDRIRFRTHRHKAPKGITSTPLGL
jgi:uncharacterized membrane protein